MSSATIQTISGRYFFFENPETHYFGIEEIAHALSQVCRYNGHTKAFYSVAQHSVLVSYVVPAPLALIGLMHDASEAYLGDVTKPLKRLLPEYQVIEEKVEAAIAKQYGLPHPMPPEVRFADLVLLMTEKRDLMPVGMGTTDTENWPQGIAPLPAVIWPMGPEQAREYFLRRFHELVSS